ncbi:MAG: hypothetical protein ABI716_01770, partial [Candidatus Saccharibacteria bacterium]
MSLTTSNHRHFSIIFVGWLIVLATSCTLLVGASPPTINQTVASDINVTPVPETTLNQQLAQRARSSWPRYLTRDSGLIAADLLVLLMLSGIGLVTGLTFKMVEPLKAWAVHRAL